ncbi:unnamed protein product [Blepharisma stoltei]|uniref:Importin subunit alpha n=1 Tax=Blepharisma stoltei TaxID=1481888 RepID=A0AAU9J3K9_9CILI|nr:unnamed protein product [Blepharisma stoltei]
MEISISERIEERKRNYQKGIDLSELKRKRDDDAVELRRKHRLANIHKKRAVCVDGNQIVSDYNKENLKEFEFPTNFVPTELAMHENRLISAEIAPMDRFSILLAIINSQNRENLQEALVLLGKLLPFADLAVFNMIFQQEICSKLIKFLSEREKEIRSAAAWCMINLSSGPNFIVKSLLDGNLLHALTRALRDNELNEFLHYCIWIVGNLAGESLKVRDEAIKAGVLGYLANFILQNSEINEKHLSTIIWTITNLCKGVPYPPDHVFKESFRIIPIALKHNIDDILSNCCYILSYISSAGVEYVDMIFNSGILPIIILLVNRENYKIQIPALRVLGNIFSSEINLHTQTLLNLGVLDSLFKLLDSSKRGIRKESLWCFSNIMGGTDDQINCVLDHQEVWKISNALVDTDMEIQKEALWVIGNASESKNKKTVLRLSGILPQLIRVLQNKEAGVLKLALKILEKMLTAGKDCFSSMKYFGVNEIGIKFFELGGLDVLEDLQFHKNSRIYEMVVKIMAEFYGVEEVPDVELQTEEIPNFVFS